MGQTLLLLDADTLAGWRRPAPSLAQLHHAVLHLERNRPGDQVAVIADPALKWNLVGEEQGRFEADIVARLITCAPAGAIDGTHGFILAVADRAKAQGHTVLAVSDRALPGVPLARLRCDDIGRWTIEEAGTVDAARAKQAGAGKRAPRRRRSG
ncbi:MAG: hypothetical protein M3527_07890 [Actinomycetota bacterium]|nr:hypothetical protein [Acidimicrobiia bacterium]MDQ3294354.1 hypothetical protein [Actinomycetota bacterium]